MLFSKGWVLEHTLEVVFGDDVVHDGRVGPCIDQVRVIVLRLWVAWTLLPVADALLQRELLSGSDVVMFIAFDAFAPVILVEALLFQGFEHLCVYWDRVLS